MTPLILIPKPDWSLSLIIQESIAKDHFCCFYYGWLIYMIYSKDILALIEDNSEDLTINDLRSISFLCDCLAQDREMQLMRESEEDARHFFYTGE